MRRRLGTWLFVGLTAIGCATTGTFQGQVYRGPQTSYRIGSLPPDWTPVRVNQEDDLAWHSAEKEAVLHVASNCDPSLDIPLKALRTHLLIGFTEREIIDEEVIAMDSREALRTHLEAKLDGVPREILLQILKKDECVYDFGLIAPPGVPYEAALDDFETMVGGFTTELDAS